jgi:hypothetical protein
VHHIDLLLLHYLFPDLLIHHQGLVVFTSAIVAFVALSMSLLKFKNPPKSPENNLYKAVTTLTTAPNAPHCLFYLIYNWVKFRHITN